MGLRDSLGPDFAPKLSIVEQESKKIWSKGELNHLYYTLHGVDHSENVINVLDKLVVGIKPESELNEIEIFCLVSAAYLHDVGMQIKYSDDEQILQSFKHKTRDYSVQDLIRDQHHKRSGRYIKENSKNLQLDYYEAEIIRLVSEGHRKVDLNSEEYDDRIIGNDSIRVRLLAALLRLADELDVSYKRAPNALFEILEKDMPEFSVLQWLKHRHTSGVSIRLIGDSIAIDIHCHYPNEEDGKLVENIIIEPITQTFNDVQVILLTHSLKISLNHKLTLDCDLDEIPEHICGKYLRMNLKSDTELPKTKGFIGRDEELQQLSCSLDKNIIVIEGIAGIGKTYVAVNFAEKLKAEYDIFWYENLSEVTTLSSALNKLAIFLKEKGQSRMLNSIENFGYDNDVLISLLKEELNSSSIAIFFDDYHKAEKELDSLLSQLKDIDSSKVIVVTREKPNFYNVLDERDGKIFTIKIDGWNLEHTKMMLEERSLSPDPATLSKIHERLHGHPQYLNLFCILSANEDAGALFEKIPLVLKDAHKYLETEVYNSLSSQEKLLLQTISIFRIAETVDAFDSINKFDNLTETLDALIYKFLVNEIGVNKFKVHDIIRAFCLGDFGKAKTLKKYHASAAEYYSSDVDNLESILESSHHYNKAGMSEQSATILISHANKFISKGFWQKIEKQLNESINLFRRKTQPNMIYLSAKANFQIAELYKRKNDLNQAFSYCSAAIRLFKRINAHNELFNPYNLLVNIYYEWNNEKKGQEYLLLSEKIAKSIDDNQVKMIHKGNCLNYLDDSENDEKLKSYFELLEFFESDMNERNVATTLSFISFIYGNMGDFDNSLLYAKKMLNIYMQRNDSFDITIAKVEIVKIYTKFPDKITDVNRLLECLDEILDMYVEIGHIRGEHSIATVKGNLLVELKDFDSAIESYQCAVKTSSILNEYDFDSRLSIGNCLTRAKRYDESASHFSEMLGMGNFKGENLLCTKFSLVEVQMLNGDYESALKKSIELIEESKSDDSSKYFCLGNLFAAISSLELGNLLDSSSHLQSIVNFQNLEKSINWDFSDIEPVLNKLGTKKQMISDVISYLKKETNYPIIRLNDVQIESKMMHESGEFLHPFVGSLEISKDDPDLQLLFSNLSRSVEIDQDSSHIMGINREKALLILGFFLEKGIIECNFIKDSIFEVKLTEAGCKIRI